ncbi:hypothetical protein CWI38_0259p0030 [Hamiltosporidium tvaerminnensis]|uniref:Uncharacterized protein n=1 Tax=Hamiltosporidium tvaerminnensis TaxID=1176355 RepID=A0A4Q9LYZ1_9MICR|nr:hypothetical protein CWI38_0259p0030 [Hamiltosporidium tvaerminnensis]
MLILKIKLLFLLITYTSGSSFFQSFLENNLESKKQKQLLNEFHEFQESQLGKLLKDQYKDNKDFGFVMIYFGESIFLDLCYSGCKLKDITDDISSLLELLRKRSYVEENSQNETLKKVSEWIERLNLVVLPFIFSLDKFEKFTSEYSPDISAQAIRCVTEKLNVIGFLHKFGTFVKECKNHIEMFGLLNVSFNDSLLNITLEKYINHDFHTVKSFQISLDHSDPRAFFVFILYKANIFDKNHVYDSFLKKIYPDTVLKQIIGDALAAEIKTVDGMKEFLPAYIPKIEEIKEKLNAIEKRLKNIESLGWVQSALVNLSLWYWKTLVSILIEQKEVVCNYLDDPDTFFDMIRTLILTKKLEIFLPIFDKFKKTNEEVLDSCLAAIKVFLLKFYKEFFEKKFGKTEEANLLGSIKFLNEEILKLSKNSRFLDLYVSILEIYKENCSTDSKEIIMIFSRTAKEFFLAYIRLYEAILIE